MENKEGAAITLFMSTYPPRECGIATFTRDLTEAIDKNLNPMQTGILALNDNTRPAIVVNIDQTTNSAIKINGMNFIFVTLLFVCLRFN